MSQPPPAVAAATMPQLPPGVAIAIAIITLIGVLVTAFVHYINAKRQREQADKLDTMKRDFDRAINERNHEAAKELAAVKAQLDEEIDYRRIMATLNAENWRHVSQGLRSLRDTGFAMSDAFKTLAASAHSNIAISEDHLIAESLMALRRHDEFRNALRALRGEIRPQDYSELENFLKYLVIVFLDVGRTPDERHAKIAILKAHEDEITRREQRFQVLVGLFLQPYTRRKKASPASIAGPKSHDTAATMTASGPSSA